MFLTCHSSRFSNSCPEDWDYLLDNKFYEGVDTGVRVILTKIRMPVGLRKTMWQVKPLIAPSHGSYIAVMPQTLMIFQVLGYVIRMDLLTS